LHPAARSIPCRYQISLLDFNTTLNHINTGDRTVSKLVLADLKRNDELDAAALGAVLGGSGSTIVVSPKRSKLGTKNDGKSSRKKVTKKINALQQTLMGSGIGKLTPPRVLKRRSSTSTFNI